MKLAPAAGIATGARLRGMAVCTSFQLLIQAVLCLLADPDLCRLSALCRSFHVLSLNELFTRNGVLQPTSPILSIPVPGSSVKAFLPTGDNGLCITLTKEDHLGVLGLRLALPHLFEGLHQIAALVCIFNGPPFHVWKEIPSLGRFLLSSLLASSIEAVVLDFNRVAVGHFLGRDSRHDMYSHDRDPRGVKAVSDLFRIFAGGQGGMVMRCCTSLTVLGGEVDVDFIRWVNLQSRERGEEITAEEVGERTAKPVFDKLLANIAARPINSFFRFKLAARSFIPNISASKSSKAPNSARQSFKLGAINIHTNL
ncbi:hypothetical protein AX16_006715, partial [Volvariella volvacea WC 439]